MRSFWIFSFLVSAAAATISWFLWWPFWFSFILIVPMILVGISDLSQNKHTLRKNYPILGRMRWMAEWMRPKVYQYFIESDTDGAPFNRLSRNVIYQRAKKVNDTTPFGTQLDVYETGYEWLNHSIVPLNHDKVDH
ncbi:MAG: FMN-binding glutamate synthase family protein, partial [Bacteroidia bacterium]